MNSPQKVKSLLRTVMQAIDNQYDKPELKVPTAATKRRLFLRNEANLRCDGNVMKSRPKAHWKGSGSQPKRSQFAAGSGGGTVDFTTPKDFGCL
jgi:hypothetical protein